VSNKIKKEKSSGSDVLEEIHKKITCLISSIVKGNAQSGVTVLSINQIFSKNLNLRKYFYKMTKVIYKNHLCLLRIGEL
jgi:hypothetical protein